MSNTGSTASDKRRLIEGTAYMLYGHGPCDLVSSTDLVHDASSHQHDYQQQSRQSHQHDHDHDHDPDPPKHFWAIFTPEKDTLITPDGTISTTSTKGDGSTDCHLLLSGTPHAWGIFPPEMPEPHGCIPPHLYYEVSLLWPRKKPTTVINDINTEGNRNQRHDYEEHIIPFVHRFGDNKNDAGGLTTGYHLLEELESADDYGAFMDELIHVFQSASVASRGDLPPKSSKVTSCSQVALYACTEVLFSDTKTRRLIQDIFFSLAAKTPLPSTMMQFVNNCYKSSESSEPPNTPWVLKSDLKILLPVKDLQFS